MAFKTMAVVSPHIQGAEVTRRQKLLNGGNILKVDALQGLVDGDFGPETGRACIRAKYWFGYAQLDQTPVYGEKLDRLLTGEDALPAEFLRRRTARVTAAAQTPLRVKAFAEAVKDLGMKEQPAGSNHSPISDAWGVTGPWCAMGVSTWYIRAGSKAFVMHRDFAYVPFMLAAAVHGGTGLAVVRADHVQHGDPVPFDWPGESPGVADHVGLFDEWVVEGQTFKTVEGNTAVGNDSNGGEVMRRDRDISEVARVGATPAFIHVGR